MQEFDPAAQADALAAGTSVDTGGSSSGGSLGDLTLPGQFIAENNLRDLVGEENFPDVPLIFNNEGRQDFIEGSLGAAAGTVFLEQEYRDPDLSSEWYALPLEARIGIQSVMAQRGINGATPKNMNFDGELSGKTLTTFKKVLETANGKGLPWQLSFNAMQGQATATGAGSGRGRSGPVRAPYQAPDPAELRESIRTTFRSAFNRDPQGAELEALAPQYERLFRQQYDSATASTAVNANARFSELIRDKYSTELDIIEQRDAARANEQQGQAVRGVVDSIVSAGSNGGLV